jgi:circadian clock protein KaiB
MSAAEAFRLRLFVAGDGPNSVRALANLTALCDRHLRGRHEIEVVDVLREPHRALSEGVYLTPTLVKLSPHPVRRVVGSLSDSAPVLVALGLGGVDAA